MPVYFQVKQHLIENDSQHTSSSSRLLRLRLSKTDINLEFKPLVLVDPSVLLSTRMPLTNPRIGDYQLKQTSSTEGIASKKNLELKKRYLLGENVSASGIMKSDSTSILDTKLRNFHSNISGCQKLLNPAPDISPALKHFLKNTMASEVENFTVQTENCSNANEEKENLYGHIVNTKNELNKTDNSEVCNRNKSENTEISNDTIYQNTEKPSSNTVIDLVAPENAGIVQNSTDKNCHFDISTDKVFIDLTGDTSEELLRNTSGQTDVYGDLMPKIEIKQTLLSDHGHSFEHQTLRNNASVSANRILKEMDSTSSRSSTDTSSGSPDVFPHLILESTTNTSTDATPIESSELMQMDSLMIIDGKYTGDPEDLKHMKIPDIMKNDCKSTYKNTSDMKTAPVSLKQAYKYESIHKRPELKFDARNENKIDSLRNLPLILPKQIDQSAAKIAKELTLSIRDRNDESNLSDSDKTPTVLNPGIMRDRATTDEATDKSDSETETTGCICTETELSDWAADDAVSENFVDIEFALNSNKGTIKLNKKAKTRAAKLVAARQQMSLEQRYQCPIATSLDIEGIEFMDTGSEDSCIETYAATNDAMLKNRGYVQFVNAKAPDPTTDQYSYELDTKNEDEENHYVDVEKMGSVEFIEQGACVLDETTDFNTPNAKTSGILLQSKEVKSEFVDASLNEVEDESLVLTSSKEGENNTTEESEALTIVLSPQESTQRKIESTEYPEQSQTNCSYLPDSKFASNKDSDDITYEDYVRQLQMAITQISNARDSIDIRKMKRKHSKGEISAGEQSKLVQSITQHQQDLQQLPYTVADKYNTNSNKYLSIYVSKTDEPTITVNEKLEEITKERTKQKDLIHDLVMDKLQSKKQLNAEKRLNRSRNRSSALSISPSSNVLPPPPPNATTITTDNTNTEIIDAQNLFISSSVVEDRSCMYDNPKARKNEDFDQKKILRSDQRPLSDNVDAYFETPKLNKTKSFCAYEKKASNMPELKSKSSVKAHHQSRRISNINTFNTSFIPSRRNPEDTYQSTDELRQDAKLRARLMSNQELGLSPDDKTNLLRKSKKSETTKSATSSAHQEVSNFTQPMSQPNKSDDMKVRERKMLASKSVNDIAATNSVLDCDTGSVGNFTSESNLHSDKSAKLRQKDPERRKSIIQAVSDFFHKKRDKEQPVSPKEKNDSVFGIFRISPKAKSKVTMYLFYFTLFYWQQTFFFRHQTYFFCYQIYFLCHQIIFFWPQKMQSVALKNIFLLPLDFAAVRIIQKWISLDLVGSLN